ncbi:MAG TPA: methylmalonyl-CoA mutase [Dehalococcoidia bacterium]|jgi:methylmalonyl-CoA mutase N-terminal domain/subunit|nr:methylmalonyl-CoA mutase [Dehalococcoidia bacterium]
MTTRQVTYDRAYGSLVRTATQSGIEVKPVYTPQDIADIDYERDIGLPGQYPFTRGIYPEMYRNRLWLKAFIVCYATPEETNRAFKEYIAAGQTGLRILTDTTTLSGVDPDHPLARYDIMCNGNPTFALTEYETMLDGIPLEDVDYESANSTPSGSFFTAVFLVGLVEKMGCDIKRLRGTNINDPIQAFILYGTPEFPMDLARRVTTDLIEFGAKYTPRWHPSTPDGYNMRDAGIDTFRELAFCIANIIQYYGDAIKERGVKLDDFRPMVFSTSAESDFFETACKFRALRRMWARIAKERLGATKPDSMKCRIAIRTAANSMYPQKPINNTARVAYQILGAVLGGVQSIDPSGIDEVFGEPSPESRIFELDIQHIIAHELNVPLVADPLAGSYYVEWLTKRIEEGTWKILNEIDAQGGMWAALKSGWLKQQFDIPTINLYKEIEEGKRLIVGVNSFKGEDGAISRAIIDSAYKVPADPKRFGAIDKVKRLRATRDERKVVDSLNELYRATRDGENIVRPAIEAAKAYATVGEMVGAIRMASGYCYDPYEMVQTPPFMKHLEPSANR